MSARLKIPRTLTFSELQTPTAQGETDEILNNKSMVLVLYHISMTVPFAGDSSQPVERFATQKALGARCTVRMTLEWDTSPVIYTFG